MKQDKILYLAPRVRILDVRVEGIVCTSPTNESLLPTDMAGDWVLDV